MTLIFAPSGAFRMRGASTVFEVAPAKTEVRKVGVLHDPTPYGNLQKDLAVKAAPDYGVEVPVVEQYKQDDADFNTQISKMEAAGAKAIVKTGLGGSTLTVAKNIKQLGLKTLLMGSVDDLAVFKPAGETLGDQFVFVASPAQVFDVLPEGAMKQEIACPFGAPSMATGTPCGLARLGTP